MHHFSHGQLLIGPVVNTKDFSFDGINASVLWYSRDGEVHVKENITV